MNGIANAVRMNVCTSSAHPTVTRSGDDAPNPCATHAISLAARRHLHVGRARAAARDAHLEAAACDARDLAKRHGLEQRRLSPLAQRGRAAGERDVEEEADHGRAAADLRLDALLEDVPDLNTWIQRTN